MNMDECPCSGKTLSKLVQPAAMAFLASGPLHGYLVAERLRKMAMFKGHRPDPTGLYRVLREMEENGLLTSTWDLPDSGPPRRTFALTAKGRACKERWIRTLEGYQKAIHEMLAILKKSATTKPTRRAGRQKRRLQRHRAS
jgi:DNA-binding PadR family transcriptional regulator